MSTERGSAYKLREEAHYKLSKEANCKLSEKAHDKKQNKKRAANAALFNVEMKLTEIGL